VAAVPHEDISLTGDPQTAADRAMPLTTHAIRVEEALGLFAVDARHGYNVRRSALGLTETRMVQRPTIKVQQRPPASSSVGCGVRSTS
jgi:hypothetical protein